MKAKKTLLFAMVAAMALAMVLFVAGCGEKNESDSDVEKTTEATTAETTTKAPEESDILKAYLQKMIEDLGRGSADGKGVTYAKKLDMDGDGKPELLTIHDMKVEIFEVKDNQAQSIFTGDIGIEYGQTSAGYRVMLNEKEKPMTVVLFNSSDEWVDENITVVSVSNGQAVEKNMRASTNGENDTPAREELVNFSIDGAEVPAGEYNSEYEKLTTNAEEINPMNPIDLDEVIAGM